jgi:hypothetical protein
MPKERVAIATIDWQQAQCIGNGAWGDIWCIGNGIVAKVGINIAQDEALAQQYVYERYNAALPVLGYQGAVMLPERIRSSYCPKHGHGESDERRGIFKGYYEKECSCDLPLDVLCMPRADPDYAFFAWQVSIERFTRHITTICQEELQRSWEAHEKNMAWWNGHLVALDFMDDEYSGKPYLVHWILHEEFPFAVYDDSGELHQFYASLEAVKQAYGSMEQRRRIDHTIRHIARDTAISVEDLWVEGAELL